MACSPECAFGRSSVSKDDLWHRDHELSLPEMIIDSLEGQIESFRWKDTRRGDSQPIQWKELDEDEIKSMCNDPEPEFNSDTSRTALQFNLSESDRRQKEGTSV